MAVAARVGTPGDGADQAGGGHLNPEGGSARRGAARSLPTCLGRPGRNRRCAARESDGEWRSARGPGFREGGESEAGKKRGVDRFPRAEPRTNEGDQAQTHDGLRMEEGWRAVNADERPGTDGRPVTTQRTVGVRGPLRRSRCRSSGGRGRRGFGLGLEFRRGRTWWWPGSRLR
jgi:hypothetical protein